MFILINNNKTHGRFKFTIKRLKKIMKVATAATKSFKLLWLSKVESTTLQSQLEELIISLFALILL